MLAQPEVAGAFSGVGFAGPDGGQDPTRGIMFVMLHSLKDRKRDVQTRKQLFAAAAAAAGGG